MNRTGGTLTEGYDYAFSRLDPATGAHVDPAWCAVYETATYLDSTGALAPMLASSWLYDEREPTWRLSVRPGARFHSGRACDADAVAAAFRLHADPVESPVNAFFWSAVRDVGVEAGEVVVRLHHPCIGLPRLLRSWHAAVHDQARREELGETYGHGNADGTGPFRFRGWDPDAWLEVERWDGFRGAAHLDTIRWVSILDERARAAALEAGEVDCIQNASVLDARRLEENDELRVVVFQQSALVYLALDQLTPGLPFADVRVRRALARAIDRDAIVERELVGYGWPQHGPIPSASSWYEPDVETRNAYDPRDAAALLDAAGLPPGPGGTRLSFEALVLDDAVVRLAAGSVQAMLRDVGVDVELRPVAGFAEFYAALGDHPPAFFSKWFWPDPVDAIVGFVASWAHDGPNWQRASHPEIDAACRAWQTAGDESAQAAAASALQLATAEHLPLIPLLAPAAVWAHHRRVHGWTPSAENLYPLYNDVWLEHGTVRP